MTNRMRLSLLGIALALVAGIASFALTINRGSADAVVPLPGPDDWGETQGVWCGEGCDGYLYTVDMNHENGPGEKRPPIPVYERGSDRLLGHMYDGAGFTALGTEPQYRGITTIVETGSDHVTIREVVLGKEQPPVVHEFSNCQEYEQIRVETEVALDSECPIAISQQ